MARGDTENAFQAAAAADGITLIRARVAWLNRRGHLGLPPEAAWAVPALRSIFDALGGIEAQQTGKNTTPLPGDFLHPESNTFIEIDEHQHFTTHRLTSLLLYPDDVPLGFDIDEYRDLCGAWGPKADRYFTSKDAVGFGQGGRQRQRAYNDALRDLVVPALGYPAVVRVAAPERDGREAYRRVRDRVRALRDLAPKT